MIRPAVTSDIARLLELLQDLFSLEADFDFNAEKQSKGLKLLIESPGGVVLVSEEQDQITGMVTGQLVISTAEGGPSLLVEDMVVAKIMRGKGIGGRLLTAVGEWGEERGACRLQLLADRNNLAAFEFYNKLGWTRTNLVCMRKYNCGAGI